MRWWNIPLERARLGASDPRMVVLRPAARHRQRAVVRARILSLVETRAVIEDGQMLRRKCTGKIRNTCRRYLLLD